MADDFAGVGLGEGPALPVDWSHALAANGHWLRRVIYLRTGEQQAVEDVMQEVSLAAVRQTVAIDAAPAWLYRVAVRQSLLYRRKCGRRRKLIDRAAAHAPPATNGDGGDPLDWLVLAERRDLVRTALARLTRRDAEVLMLKYTERWTCKQMADHLGATEKCVESRLLRARQRMREELARLTRSEDAP